MSSPAARYAAARVRAEQARTPLGAFTGMLDFELDDFQVRACEALQEGRGVLVAAPTGSGKTVVGEFAVHMARETGRKAFYTTPIKALSNQKYADLVRRYGSDHVGLLTGDNSVNGNAPVVVMTTEVLRNMLYASSPALRGLGYVVMDEVHYLADRFRGAVWEEVIIHLPDDVSVVSLSATVSNAEEFGGWLQEVRGDTEVVVSEHRPVPLWQHVLVGTRLYDLFTAKDGDPLEGDLGSLVPGAVLNPELVRLAREDERRERLERGARGSGAGRRPYRRPPGRGRGTASRAQVLEALDGAGLLPAITFVFSRAGCEAAVEQCLSWGLRLTSEEEREEVRRVVELRTADIPESDLTVLGYWDWVEALERGLAAHHAGMLPTFKEVVEELFVRGLVKAVFATETLALGINMPARSVVLEKLVKWNGETHADLTPGEYTQLTGRAGRRGIDVEGHAVVLWQPGTDPEAIAGLASTRTYPLRSSFRPTYNMAVNLVSQVGRDTAREVLETSFAQYQADRAVVGLAKQLRKQEEALDGYAAAMRCHLGDFGEYAALRRSVADREADLSRQRSSDRRADAVTSLERLRVGDVIRVPAGKRAGFAVVVDSGVAGGSDGPRPTVLTADRQVRRLSAVDVPTAVEPVATVKVPKRFDARSPQARRDLASSMRTALADVGGGIDATVPRRGGRGAARRAAAADDAELSRLRRQLRAHPCHGCDEREDHARWAERHHRLQRETASLQRRIDARTSSIAVTFDRVCELLAEVDYLREDGGASVVTAAGERLKRLYAEKDLLVAECLRSGAWDGLDPAGLAAVVSSLVYEARRDDAPEPRVPRGPVADALAATVQQWSLLDDRERARRLPPTPAPDLGIVHAVHRWALGASLQQVLADADLAAGDFVRWCKQLVDLLGQVEQAAAATPGSQRLAQTAARAVDAVRRGVVAYSSVA